MQPDPKRLIKRLGLGTPLVGLYDAPDPSPFEPLVCPGGTNGVCVFSFYEAWARGKTLHLTKENFGCGGAGYWLCEAETRSREQFVRFLAETEGLKSSMDRMNAWLDQHRPYRREHPHLLIGPLRPEGYGHLKTVTFYVTPDQLSALMIGAQYDSAPGDCPSVMAEFGSGCMQLLPLFQDVDLPQAMIGATDIAMRRHIPPDIMAFTVTRPMFERLCRLDERSFLYRSFWGDLRTARAAK